MFLTCHNTHLNSAFAEQWVDWVLLTVNKNSQRLCAVQVYLKLLHRFNTKQHTRTHVTVTIQVTLVSKFCIPDTELLSKLVRGFRAVRGQKWGFPSTLTVALTTGQHYCAACDKIHHCYKNTTLSNRNRLSAANRYHALGKMSLFFAIFSASWQI